MRFMSSLMTLVLAGSALAQEKPSPAVPFEQIFKCVQAADCRNMTAAPISAWSDAFGFRGMVFDEAGWKYELYITGPTRDDLSIQMMAPGETRSSHLLTLDRNGVLALAELKIDGGGASRVPMTDELLAARQLARRAYVVAPRWPRGGTLGEEFRPFWQKLADQALVAIRRTLARADSAPAQEKPALSIADIRACAEKFACANMKRSSLNWYDQVGIPVVEFSEDGYRYALRNNSKEGLSIWIAIKSESRPSRLLSIGNDAKVISAELFSVPPGGGWPRRLTPEERDKWYKDAKILSPAMEIRAAVGEEYRTFWQELADQALAAIRRTISK